QAEDGIRGFHVTGVQTCALPISVAMRSLQEADNAKILALKAEADKTAALHVAKKAVETAKEADKKLSEVEGQAHANNIVLMSARSEERRVGKDDRCGGSPEQWKK